MAELVNMRDRGCEYIASTLHFVADHIDRYMPDEVCLIESEFVVRVPMDKTTIPTVELDATMPAMAIFKRTE